MAWTASARTTLARAETELVVRFAFGDDLGGPVEVQPRETSLDEGGVALGFHGAAVALFRVMLEDDGTGLPGAGSARQPFVAYYWLAQGEVWGVTKAGSVSIR